MATVVNCVADPVTGFKRSTSVSGAVTAMSGGGTLFLWLATWTDDEDDEPARRSVIRDDA